MSRAIALADHGVCVHSCLTVLLGEVPGQCQDLDLFPNRDLSIGLPLRIEESKNDLAERADGGEMRGPNLGISAERQQRGSHFLALVEHDDMNFVRLCRDRSRTQRLEPVLSRRRIK